MVLNIHGENTYCTLDNQQGVSNVVFVNKTIWWMLTRTSERQRHHPLSPLCFQAWKHSILMTSRMTLLWGHAAASSCHLQATSSTVNEKFSRAATGRPVSPNTSNNSKQTTYMLQIDKCCPTMSQCKAVYLTSFLQTSCLTLCILLVTEQRPGKKYSVNIAMPTYFPFHMSANHIFTQRSPQSKRLTTKSKKSPHQTGESKPCRPTKCQTTSRWQLFVAQTTGLQPQQRTKATQVCLQALISLAWRVTKPHARSCPQMAAKSGPRVFRVLPTCSSAASLPLPATLHSLSPRHACVLACPLVSYSYRNISGHRRGIYPAPQVLDHHVPNLAPWLPYPAPGSVTWPSSPESSKNSALLRDPFWSCDKKQLQVLLGSGKPRAYVYIQYIYTRFSDMFASKHVSFIHYSDGGQLLLLFIWVTTISCAK